MLLLKTPLFIVSAISLSLSALNADVTLPNIFGDHMVLQREQANPIWGKADSGKSITVNIHDQSHTTTAGTDDWRPAGTVNNVK